MKLRVAALLLGMSAGSCAYYNSMWSAERFARQARSSEAHGEDGAARGLWSQAAVKAETVLTRHPRSRWADDALVLRLEATVRGGGCSSAGVKHAEPRAGEAAVGCRDRNTPFPIRDACKRSGIIRLCLDVLID